MGRLTEEPLRVVLDRIWRQRGRLTEEDILQILEKRDQEQLARTRAFLLEEGRPDLVEELNVKLKDIRLGLASARGTWHALSEPQRNVLKAAAQGVMVRGDLSKWYYYVGLSHEKFGLKTVRNLIARELLSCDGGAFDPEKRLCITERGRFVLKHGPGGV